MSKNLILVTTPDCTYCGMVKDFIKMRNLDIPVVDATEEPSRVSVFETMSVPFFAIEGEDASQESVVAVGGQKCIAYLNNEADNLKKLK